MYIPYHTCCDGDERVDLPTGCFECVYELVVFSCFFIVCGIWEYVVIVGEFNDLYGF